MKVRLDYLGASDHCASTNPSTCAFGQSLIRLQIYKRLHSVVLSRCLWMSAFEDVTDMISESWL
jgi:hypothetical protein